MKHRRQARKLPRLLKKTGLPLKTGAAHEPAPVYIGRHREPKTRQAA